MQDFLNKSRTNQDTILTDELLETFNESQLQFLLPCYIHKTCLRNYLENSTIDIFEKAFKTNGPGSNKEKICNSLIRTP